jgi:hypothetical protein
MKQKLIPPSQKNKRKTTITDDALVFMEEIHRDFNLQK